MPDVNARPTNWVAYRSPAAAMKPDADLRDSMRELNVLVADGVTVEEHVLQVRRRLRLWPVLAAMVVTLVTDPFIGLGVGAAGWIWSHYVHGRKVREAGAFVALIAKRTPQLIVRITLEEQLELDKCACWVQLREGVPVRVATGQLALDTYQILTAHMEVAGVEFGTMRYVVGLKDAITA